MAEELTRKWWFLCLMAAVQLLPPYSSAGHHFQHGWVEAATAPLRDPYYSPDWLFPLLKVIPVLLLGFIIIRPRRCGRALGIYVALNFAGIILHQAIGKNHEYGIVVNTVGAVMFGLIGAVWAWEAYVARTDLTRVRLTWPRLALVGGSLLALAYPLNSATQRPDFSADNVLNNAAGMTFCMTVPLYLAIMFLAWPNVNLVVVRITSLIGFMVAVFNYVGFFVEPGQMWWNACLHVPLLAACVTGVYLSLFAGRDEVCAGAAAAQVQ